MTGGPGPGGGAGTGLAAAASRGAFVTVGGQLLRLLVQLAGIVVLARLLSPEDYGIVAVVAVIVGFGELIRDSGLSSAAVQAPVLTTGQRTNLFWVNSGLGLVLAALLLGASPLIALAFGDDRLAGVSQALAAVFVINGAATQYRATLMRGLRFGRLAATEITGQVAGVAAGIVLAVLGAGYWALVAQQLTQALVALVLLVATGGWLPGRVRRTETVRPFLGYGTPLLGTHVLNHLTSHLDALVIGARFGPAPVGLYNRAYQLVMMPLVQVQAPSTRVALPVLSRLREEPRRFADFLCFGQVVLLTLIGGLFALLFAQAPAVVAVALGGQWTEAVPLFRILLVAGFFQAATYAVYWVFLAHGLTRSQLRYALTTRPAMAALVVAGSAWGVQGVALAYALAVALAWPVALWWIRRAADAPVGRMLANGLRSGAVFTAAGTASWLGTLPLPADEHLLRLAVGSLAVAGAAGVAALLWPAFRRDLADLVALRRHLRRTRTGSGAGDLAPAATAAARPAASTPEDAVR